MSNLLPLLLNKWTIGIIILTVLSGTFYYQNNKINDLNEILIQKESDIKELVSSVENIQKDQKEQAKRFVEQVETIKKNMELKIKDNQKLNEKIIKSERRDEAKIFDKKLKFAEQQYNKHIKINVDKWNNGG